MPTLDLSKLDLGKAVRRVTVIRSSDSLAGGPLVVHQRTKKKKKQSKSMRPLERLARRLAEAQMTAAETYSDGHRRANRRKKNGWAKKFTSNFRRANKKFFKKLF